MKFLTPIRCAVLLALATIAAYSNSFSGVLIFDDHDIIESNPSIKSLAASLSPPKSDGITTNGRPLVNLTFAINYAIGKTRLEGYHAANLAIHICAVLVLFGILRRNLDLSIAFCAALLWALHPLQTESVAYLAQRAESLVSLLYLLTLYCYIRFANSRELGTGNREPVAKRWAAISIAACFLGMATKEVMVTAPLAVLGYDAIFVSKSLGAALRQRRGYYAGLFSAWIFLAGVLVYSGGRGGTAGLNAGISPWEYALTQCEAVIRYFKLTFWPHPLVFDYGFYFKTSLAEVAPYAVILVLLVGAAIYALFRNPRAGYLALLVFVILAPSSSVVPVTTQTSAEHRMYLALAALLVLVVVGLRRFAGRATVPICLGWAAALGVTTFLRNPIYADEMALWRDTALKAPGNARAHANLGNEYLQSGRTDEAVAELKEALRIGPPMFGALYNLGLISQQKGDVREAIEYYRRSIERNSRYAPSRTNLALMLDEAGRPAEARAEAEAAVQIEPDLVEARVNLGNILGRSGQLAAALVQFERAAALAPGNPIVLSNYATALFQLGRLEDSRVQLARAAEAAPNDAGIRMNHGFILLQLKRPVEAAAELRRALEIQPDLAPARALLQQIAGPGTPTAPK